MLVRAGSRRGQPAVLSGRHRAVRGPPNAKGRSDSLHSKRDPEEIFAPKKNKLETGVLLPAKSEGFQSAKKMRHRELPSCLDLRAKSFENIM